MNVSSNEAPGRPTARLRWERVHERLLMVLVFPLGGALIAAGVAYLVGERGLLQLVVTSVVTFVMSSLSGLALLRSTYRKGDE